MSWPTATVGSSSSRRRIALAGLVTGLVALGWGAPARAGDIALPRVPPTFTDGTCMTVARPGDVVTLGLSVPYEDTTWTDDEPADSRSLQFFATCRDRDAGESMPLWIDDADVEATAAVDPSVTPPTDAEVLSRAPRWSAPGHDGVADTCVVELDDARRPITCEATDEPLRWDTTDVPAGGYVVWGYTYQPVTSLWTRRPGVVWLEGDDAGPAIAITHPFAETTVGVDVGVHVEGCVAGPEGTTWALEWITATELEAGGAWTQADPVPAADGAVAYEWWPDPSLVYAAVFLRARAEDPSGRAFVTAPVGPVVVLAADEAPRGGAPPWADGCHARPSPWSPVVAARDLPDTDASGDEGDAEASSVDPVADESARGCGMTRRRRGGLLWALFGVWAIVTRRRS